MRRFATMVVVLCVGGSVWAQDVPDDDPELRDVVIPAVTRLDFTDGASVTGQLIGPDGALATDVRPTRFAPMLRVRTDFARELAQSVKDAR